MHFHGFIKHLWTSVVVRALTKSPSGALSSVLGRYLQCCFQVEKIPLCVITRCRFPGISSVHLKIPEFTIVELKLQGKMLPRAVSLPYLEMLPYSLCCPPANQGRRRHPSPEIKLGMWGVRRESRSNALK